MQTVNCCHKLEQYTSIAFFAVVLHTSSASIIPLMNAYALTRTLAKPVLVAWTSDRSDAEFTGMSAAGILRYNGRIHDIQTSDSITHVRIDYIQV